MFEGIGSVQRVYIHSKPSSGIPPVNQSNFFPSAPVIEVSYVYMVILNSYVSIVSVSLLNVLFGLKKSDVYSHNAES